MIDGADVPPEDIKKIAVPPWRRSTVSASTSRACRCRTTRSCSTTRWFHARTVDESEAARAVAAMVKCHRVDPLQKVRVEKELAQKLYSHHNTKQDTVHDDQSLCADDATTEPAGSSASTSVSGGEAVCVHMLGFVCVHCHCVPLVLGRLVI